MSTAPLSLMHLGSYPTPVQRIDRLSAPGSTLWVKRDDLSAALYGGNKVRKLEHLLADARARGATRLVTVGAAGSHHVLATTIFGKRAGFEVDAVLVPQPRNDAVVETLRASLAQGVHAWPAPSWSQVPWLVLRRRLAGAYYVSLGGSSVAGSMAFVDAARELATQVRKGELPEPDAIVVAVGSGGTAAGLAAGLEVAGMKTRVVGVVVAAPMWFVRWSTRRMARVCLRRAGGEASRAATHARLEIETRWCGDGYGLPTPAGVRALDAAASVGLRLDTTYTAKAFAAALDLVAKGRDANVLFWNTLSSAPMSALLEAAPAEDAIEPRVRRLLR